MIVDRKAVDIFLDKKILETKLIETAA